MLKFYRSRILNLFGVCVLYLFLSYIMNGTIHTDNLFFDSLNIFYMIYNVEDFLAAILLFLPFIMLILLTSDLFIFQLHIEIYYCFTRRRQIHIWYIKKSALIALLTALCVLFIQAGSIIVNLIYHNYPSVTLGKTIFPSMCIFFLSWMFLFSFSLLSNILSFYLPRKWVPPVLLTVLLLILLHMRYVITSGKQWLFNPAIHFYFRIHEEYMQFVPHEEFYRPIEGLTTGTSLLYFFIMILLLLLWGYKKTEKYEFGLFEED